MSEERTLGVLSQAVASLEVNGFLAEIQFRIVSLCYILQLKGQTSPDCRLISQPSFFIFSLVFV